MFRLLCFMLLVLLIPLVSVAGQAESAPLRIPEGKRGEGKGKSTAKMQVDDARGSKHNETTSRRVRLVYIVSSDREEKKEYTQAIEHAILDLQKWYGKQLGGPTFRLSDPIVEVVKSKQTAAWFTEHPNGRDKDSWGFYNALAEAKRLVGARQKDPRFIYLLYSDGPGDKGRGGGGVAYLPENDLLGLVGRHPTQKDKVRWIAGLGHELGHAFGLPHPKDTKKHHDALMWAGVYGKYPDKAYLTERDKEMLTRSPFFYYEDGEPVAGK